MSHIKNNVTLVCYDITSNRLRNKIDKCMKDFGTRIQFSIFICRLDAVGVQRCRVKLMEIIEKFACERMQNDSLIIFERLNPGNIDSLIGTKIEYDIPRFMIL